MVNSSKPVTVRNQLYSVETFKIIPSLAKAVVMFIDETLYDDAFFIKIFTDATPHTRITVPLKFFFYLCRVHFDKENLASLDHTMRHKLLRPLFLSGHQNGL